MVETSKSDPTPAKAEPSPKGNALAKIEPKKVPSTEVTPPRAYSSGGGRDALKGFSTPQRFTRLGYVLILLIFGAVGGWAATAKIDSASIAPAVVALEGDRKVVQHLEGGIVQDIRVREADVVEDGDVLVVLESIEARANMERFSVRLKEARAVEARLVAEQQFKDTIAFPQDLLANPSADLQQTFALQESILKDRLAIINSQREISQFRIEQLEAQGTGLAQQQDALERRIELRGALLERLATGEQRGVVVRNELDERQDSLIEFEAALAEVVTQIAQVGVSIGEAKLGMLQMEQEFLERTNLELRDIRSQISELQENVKVTEDILVRTEIRAPSAGSVQNVNVTTEGSVIRPGDVLMEIVPEDDELLVSARISPLDIDTVLVGQTAEVRLDAFTARLMPAIFGTLESVSDDVITPDNPQEPPYYLGRVRVVQSELPQEVQDALAPGMPASVIIVNGERTVLNYLIAPLSDAISKSMREQ
ncbi:MAG: HlyD family type I secretion periplasmic adaptor subunit [Pseudomonadota bacterium]